jgi:hypothetical protein
METAFVAALLVVMIPTFLFDTLDRALASLAVVVALPAEADAAAVATVLGEAGVNRTVTRGDPARTGELWSVFAGTGEAPRVIEAELWPAHAVDTEHLRARIAAAAPNAVTDLRPRPSALPLVPLAAAAALGVGALVARWRVARAVRRLLRAEAPTLVLIHRFGASRDWVRTHVARPVVARARRGALAGAALGAGLGLAAVGLGEPALLRPWSGVATVVAAGTAVAALATVVGLARAVVATTARHLELAARAAESVRP